MPKTGEFMIKGFEMEKQLVVPISELNDIQVKCDSCSSLMTFSLNRLEHAKLVCPSCGEAIRRAGNDEALAAFANAIRHLKGSKFNMRFVLPDNT